MARIVRSPSAIAIGRWQAQLASALDGVGEALVGLGRLIVEVVGERLEEHGGRLEGAPRGEAGAGGLRVGPHAGHPVAEQRGLHDGQPTLQRAAVRHEAVGATRGGEGRAGPPLRRGDVTEDRFAQRAEHGQLGVLLDRALAPRTSRASA